MATGYMDATAQTTEIEGADTVRLIQGALKQKDETIALLMHRIEQLQMSLGKIASLAQGEPEGLNALMGRAQADKMANEAYR